MKLLSLIILLLLIPLAAANTDIDQGKQLIDSKADCSDLTKDQLESIGEYIMEQMHPGEAHEQMDKIMGLEEGTKEHKEFHASLALSMYCQGGNMMGYNNMMGYGMMGYNSWGIYSFLYLLLLIGLIILVYIWIVKLLKSKSKKL